MTSTSNQFQALNHVQELSNYHSAKVQGGATSYGVGVYDLPGGRALIGKAKYGFRTLSAYANDDISHIKIKHGVWRFYEHTNYNRDANGNYLPGSKYITLRRTKTNGGNFDLSKLFGGIWNQRISSFRRVG